MKITNIDVNSVLGIRSAAITITKPVALFAAHNGNGKTSLAEAVRMALSGDLAARGVKLKKDLQALVHEGMADGLTEVQIDGGALAWAQLPSGKTVPATKYAPHAMLPYVMEPERFAALDEKARGTMLFELLGIKMSPKAVIERLVKRGIDATKAERVGPLLKAGFPAACAEAKEKATLAKGAWRQVTGENYGSEKGKTWTAEVPEHDAVAAAAIGEKLSKLDAELEEKQLAVGELRAQGSRRADLNTKLPELKTKVDMTDRVEKKLETDKASLADFQQKLQAARAEAGTGKREGLVHDLAASLETMFSHHYPEGDFQLDDKDRAIVEEAARVLDQYEAEHGQIGAEGNPDALAKIPALEKSVDLMTKAVSNGERDLTALRQLAGEIKAIKEELAQPFDSKALQAAETKIANIKTERSELTRQSAAIHALKVAADAAGKKTAEAAEHHADVEAWTACADALAPTGIPNEMLAEGLEPFNERLAQSAVDADWFRVSVNADMTIDAGFETNGELEVRPYKLLSESEKWRADAMLAEAVSHFSGLKFLMLDRFDVLDLDGRSNALLWLKTLSDLNELDTALVFGTLKAAPIADTFLDPFWLEHGEIAEEFEAA
ncbi:hypothetical protein CDN99_06480 [Roseateles aquatilis]|uniref:Rad50/SbcC-type AAA domain-containing protein n=1 Tax=Roseateles aquatilis TaxID=431061 RepID=A0A246JHB6_9BURK|nr:recombinase RecF [Roseateles aquatilis]OWQ92001.1 hypothetical protein CDN99_06480 [Roseateles aquatilis]